MSQGITSLSFAGARGTKRLKELLPEIVHDRIAKYERQKEWFYYRVFG